jgi:hypothetical protein
MLGARERRQLQAQHNERKRPPCKLSLHDTGSDRMGMRLPILLMTWISVMMTFLAQGA